MMTAKSGGPEARRKLFSYGLLYDSGACEAYEGSGLGQYHVTQHGKAGGDASRGGIGKDGNV